MDPMEIASMDPNPMEIASTQGSNSRRKRSPSPMLNWALLSGVGSLSDSYSAVQDDVRAPPEVVVFNLPRHLVPTNTSCLSVVSASSNIVLLHADECQSKSPTGTCCYVLVDSKHDLTMILPNRERIMGPGYLGFLDSAIGGDQCMAVELQPPTDKDKQCALFCSSDKDKWDKWVRKDIIDYPLKSRTFVPNSVISHLERLWWVDLSLGIMFCDPTEERPVLNFITLPNVLAFREDWGDKLYNRRWVGVSGGKLRFVNMLKNRNKQTQRQITVWTLDTADDSVNWQMDNELTFEKIRSHPSYEKLKLGKRLPKIAVLDSNKSNILYLYLEKKEYIFGIDMRSGKVVEGSSYRPLQMPCTQFKNHFVHQWKLLPFPQTFHVDDINSDLSSSEQWSDRSDDPLSDERSDESDKSDESDGSDGSADSGEVYFKPPPKRTPGSSSNLVSAAAADAQFIL
ncbi:hypothetical protein ACQ4PT_005308 [Festuca glaucescens]